MQIVPIISSLRRNKIGALLISMQIALTLAIVCNSLSIIQQRIQRMHRPSGIDEANIFTLGNSWVGEPSDLAARTEQDLAALRSIPGVIDAASSESFPLRGGGWSSSLMLQPEQKQPSAHAALYFGDQHMLAALGVRLVGGRWFSAEEIGEYRMNDVSAPRTMIVTRSLANMLYPAGDALGKTVYLHPKIPSQIIGIVERLQTPWVSSSWAEVFVENSMLVPYHFVNNGLDYIVRTQPGQLAAVMKQAEKTLFDTSRARVLENTRPFQETRERAYRTDRALSLILGTVCALLLTVTAFGVVGLTTYWVAQRRRQIGMRRALGARRVDILGYFQTENLLIAGAGAVLGIGLGLAANLWLVSSLEMTRMSVGYISLGAAIVLALSQASVIWPALRAASISPATAARGL
jgi:putative ABC transport system permease protein